jgi:hypothetical protein
VATSNVTPPAGAGSESETVKLKVVVPLLPSASFTSLIEREGVLLTVVVEVALLLARFESDVLEETVTVFESTVPPGRDDDVATSRLKMKPTEGAHEAVVQEIVPPLPTAGVVQDHPTGAENETKVVPEGSVSVSDTAVAMLGPSLNAEMM